MSLWIKDPARATRSALTAILVSALSVGCVSPAFNDTAYLHKVQGAAENMSGVVVTARLAVHLYLDGHSFGSYTDTIVTNAENDATSLIAGLDVVQPPSPDAARLRTKADDVLQSASAHLSSLRIAVRSGQRDAQRDLVAALADDLADLRELQGAG